MYFAKLYLRFAKLYFPAWIAQRVDRFAVIAKNVESLSLPRARTQRSAYGAQR